METSELLKKVRTIEIKTRGLSNHIFSGSYHTAFKGRGMSFSEVREYQIGDDVRSIDWNVTARFNHPYIKVFEEERELTVMLLVDISGSGKFGTTSQFKKDMIAEICAVLAFSAIQNNDKIGLILFSNQVELFISPKKGKTHILRIIRELIEFEPEHKETNINVALHYFTNAIKRRSIAFLISDFIDPTLKEDALRIANKKHDLVGIQVYDPRETELPDAGLIKVIDAETGEQKWIDTSSAAVRENYSKHWYNSQQKLKNIFSKSGVDTVSISTKEDYVPQLINLFKKRH